MNYFDKSFAMFNLAFSFTVIKKPLNGARDWNWVSSGDKCLWCGHIDCWKDTQHKESTLVYGKWPSLCEMTQYMGYDPVYGIWPSIKKVLTSIWKVTKYVWFDPVYGIWPSVWDMTQYKESNPVSGKWPSIWEMTEY